MTLTDQDIEICLRLADDPDETVSEAIIDRLFSAGLSIIPRIDEFIRTAESPVAREHCTTVLRRFRIEPLMDLIDMIQDARRSGTDINLESGVLLLNQFGQPRDAVDDIRSYLDELAIRCHAAFIKHSPANDLTQVMSLQQVLFEEEGFHGAEHKYYDPNSSYLTSVIRSHTGIPIALSVIYLLLAERIGLEMRGIGMPMHFLVYSPVLDVYPDPFHGGVFLTRNECQAFVERSGLTFNPTMIEPIDNCTIVERMVRNLAYAHDSVLDLWEAQALGTFLREISGGTEQ